MKDWQTLKQELLQDPEVKQAYDDLDPEYKLARSLIEARLAKHMTQATLAEKAGVKQSVIARLESGTSNPTVSTVSKVAGALEHELKLVAN